MQPQTQKSLKSEKNRSSQNLYNPGASPRTAIHKNYLNQSSLHSGLEFLHLGSTVGLSAISPVVRRNHHNLHKQSPVGIQNSALKGSVMASKKSLNNSARGTSYFKQQQTNKSESQSENDQYKISGLHNIEAQTKNIKNFKNVVKENLKAKKEKIKKQRENMRKRQRFRNSKARSSDTSFNTQRHSGTMTSGLKRFKAIEKQITNMASDMKRTTLTQSDDENEETNEDDFKRIERQFQRSKYTFYPDSNFVLFWDSFSFIQILYWCIFLPFQLAFQQQDLNSNFVVSLDTISEIWFLLDILISFNTGFQEKGVLIMNRKKIVISYIKGWFIFDLFISFPYDWVLVPLVDSIKMQSDSNDIEPILRSIRYLKILRLMRMIKIERFLVHIEDHIVTDITNALLRFLKLMAMTFFFAHWMACFFYAVAFKSMQKYGESWITQTQVQDSPLIEQYINALYWCITTMATVGYGDIKPQTTEERGINIVIMAIAAGVYAYILNDVGHIVSNYNILAAQYKEKMQYVNQFLINKRIPKDLRDKIYRYLDYNWELKKKIKIDEQELMELLNNDLKNQIKSHLTGRILLNVDFFETNFGVDFLSQITHIFNQKSYAVDDNIIYEDQIGDELFFIIQGRVAIIHKRSHTYIQDLYKDQYFGEIGFFGDIPRVCSGKSRDFTDVYSIKRDDFLQIATNFSQAINMFNKIKDSLFLGQKDYKLLQVVCYVCGKKKNHISLDCTQFRDIAGNLRIRYNKIHGISSSTRKNNKNDDNNNEHTVPPSPGIFFKNNLIVPRHSFTKQQIQMLLAGTDPDMMTEGIQKDAQSNDEEPISATLDDFEEDTEDDKQDNQLSHDNSNLTLEQQHILIVNGGLEDIQEDTSLEESENFEDTGVKRTRTPKNMSTKGMNSQSIQEAHTSFKRTTTDINSIGSRKASKIDLSIPHQNLKTGQNISITLPINEVSDSSCLKTDQEEKDLQLKWQQELQRQTDVFNHQQIQACKIRPLRGIRKNTINKNFKIKTAKMFTEDFVDELPKIAHNDIDYTPKKVFQSFLKKEGDNNNIQDCIGLLSMISSKESQDFGFHYNNAQPQLKSNSSQRKKSYFKYKESSSNLKGLGNSCYSIQVQTTNKQSQPLSIDNQLQINKQKTSAFSQRKNDEQPQQLNQFQKIKNINFAANISNIQRSNKSYSIKSPSNFSERLEEKQSIIYKSQFRKQSNQ